ncbi:acetyltransferase, partial [Mycobacterium tuberculosis]
RRGVRALAAFGRPPAAPALPPPGAVPPAVRPVLAALGACCVAPCLLAAPFLLAVGFVVVAPPPSFPRLRLA